MQTQGWVVLVLLLLALEVGATCRPSGERALTIGYSHKLDGSNESSLKSAAEELGYKLLYRDLGKQSSIELALTTVDGFLIPGGADINPAYYIKEGLPVEIKLALEKHKHHFNSSSEGRKRDPFEYAVYQVYFSQEQFRTLPALGICRGMQMMAVAKGIPLVVDIQAELGIKNRYNRFDRFEILDENSVMGRSFETSSDRGYKYHHQNPRMDYLSQYGERHPDVRVTATSWEGKLSEAIELTDRPALGVQFHPEKSTASVKLGVFKWFLTAACQRSHQGAKQ